MMTKIPLQKAKEAVRRRVARLAPLARSAPDPAGAARVPLIQLLGERDVLLEDTITREQIFARLARHWSGDDVALADGIAAALEAREALGSTGLGKEVALPHARLEGLTAPRVAILRTRDGIAFDAPDGELVRLFFALIVPAHSHEDNLQLLAEVATVLADVRVRDGLLVCQTAVEMIALVTDLLRLEAASKGRG